VHLISHPHPTPPPPPVQWTLTWINESAITCSPERVGTAHCITPLPYRRSVGVYRTVRNDYTVTVRWLVKTIHCSLPTCTVGAAYMVVNTKDVDSLITKMCALRCSLPGWDAYSAILIDWMKALKGRGRSPQPEDGLHLPVIQVIMDMLEALRASNSLYDKLTPHTPLILGKDFSGTPHCEACLCLLKCKNLCTEPHAKVVGWLQEKLRVCPSSFIP